MNDPSKKPSGLLYIVALLSLLTSCGEKVDHIMVAAGGGYKKPVMEYCEYFTRETGIEVNTIFGNMQTISMQVKQSGEVGVLVGDRKFLANPAIGVEYSAYDLLGKGKLVLAYPKDTVLTGPEDLLDDSITQISMPDTKKAIYGIAGMEYLQSLGYWEALSGKMLIAATVPQVSSYLISGEIDAGFINLTDAIGIENQIGGYIEVEELYSPIEIVAGTVDGFESNPGIEEFIDYLDTDEATAIFRSYGL